jgi:CRP-like cAMP-binding protein
MANLTDFLHTVPLFQDLDGPTLSTLAALLAPRRIKAGGTIFRESEVSDALYVVERGRVVVSKHVHGDVDIVITRFQPGDFFGEMGLFDAAPRSASALAEVDSMLWSLQRDAFNKILADHAEIGAKICYRLVRVFIERLRATNEQAREAIRWGLEATGYSPITDPVLLDRKST